MINYIIGKVVSISSKSIVVENNYVGYSIFVAEPSSYTVGKIIKIYIQKNLNINNKNFIVEELYGFNNYEQKDFFNQILKISGLGYKTAIGIIKNDVALLKELISKQDIDALTSLQNITNKVAHMLIADIKFAGESINQTNNDDVIKALDALGYNKKDIDYALKNLKVNKETELSDIIANAIKIICNQNCI